MQRFKKLLIKKTKMARFVAKVSKAARKKAENGPAVKGEKVVCIRMVTVMAFASLR